MRVMQMVAGVAIWLTATVAGVQAQQALPDHRYVYTQDADFYGADLGPLFETTRDACARACTAQSACTAFTFNTRSNACFPKSAITQVEFFEGALSARKLVTPAVAQAVAAERRAEMIFLKPSDFDAAAQLVQTNADRYQTGNITVEDAVSAMNAAIARGDIPSAARWAGSAVALTDRGDLWAQLAWLGLRPRGDTPRNLAQRLQREAVPAALNAYLRAESRPEQVNALDLMARALEANGQGREMIALLRLAVALEPREELQAALDTAIGKYGFRITQTRVDNNSARPRICAEFSEKLLQAGTDYEPFVRLENTSLVVEAGEREICIDGVSHGARYTATFRAGLPAASGEVLHKDVPVTLYVRDRDPSVRFSGRAYVLPRSTQAALPVETVNTDSVELQLRRVSDRNLLRAMQDSYFGKPLSKYQEDRFAATIAQDIWSGTGEVQNTLNTAMTTRLPLGDALKDQPAGIYALTAGIKGADPYDNPAATQWFILTDLGLSTMSGTDGLHVTVRSLGSADALAGVTLSLISRANAVLGEVVTDAQGRAHFPRGLTRGGGAAAPALLMAQEPDGDAAFLSLTEPEFDLSDRGVEGRPPAPPIDTFVTTDRGAYRVGETVYATVLTRDTQGRAINGLPLVAVLKRPDGAEYSRMLTANAVAGGHVFAMPIGAQAPRGAWRLDIIADPAEGPLSSQTILVEDFLPDRIEFDLTLPDAPLALGDTPPLQVDARYLFGAPAADLAVEGEARLRTTRRLDAYQNYLFGRHDERFDTRTNYIDPVRTDAQGQAQLSLIMPQVDELPSQPLELAITTRVAEGSGRPVEQRLTRTLVPQGPLIGIKPAFEDVLSEGAEAQFDLIATQGNMPVRWTFNRVDTQYQWYQNGGSWAWEPITRRIRVDSGELSLSEQPTPLSVPTQWGQYELVVEHLGAPYAVTSVSVASGWYGGDDASATPDFLAVSLDRETYSVGDTAQLRVVAPESGVAEIAVLSNRVIEQQSLRVEAGETVIPLTVTEDWGSSAYVTASVIRPMDAQQDLNPARSLGLAHAAVRPAAKQLTVTLDPAGEVDGQAATLHVPVQVTGIAEGETAYLTLAAVDVGILNLTDFAVPDPSAHYFGQRRLGVGLRDVYGRLIDGLSGAMGSVRSGGDAALSAQLQSPPPTEALMAFFSGPVAVDAEGRAVVEVTRPAFNGTIRLMAVAWSESGVGNATRDVVARDPVVITASLPRLLAPQDTSRLLLEMVHTRGDSGVMKLDVFADAGIAMGAVPAVVNITESGTLRLPLDLVAREIGDHRITVQLTTPDGTVLQRVLTLPVRINDPEIATTRRFSLGAGETFTFDNAVLSGLREGTASATLTAGPLARFDVPGLLRQLDRYPYGCTEQVASASLPLLYLGDLAQSAGIGSPSEINEKIAEGIARVLARQASNGAFGMWHPDTGAFWLDAYVTDFLWRAQAQGHPVPQRAVSSALDNLRNRVNFAPDFDKGGEDIAYALLVLTRAGAAQMGDLRYYADTKAAAFATPMAAAQLGAALAAYGDPVRADKMFARAGALLLTPTDRNQWRDDFGSDLRDRAAVLKLAAEAGSEKVNLEALAQSMQASRNLSTQEAAQVVLAAHALDVAPAGNSGMEVDGTPVSGPLVRKLSDRDPQTTMVRNVSDTPTDITLTAYGVPEVAPDAGGYGYALTRRYFTMEGEAVSGPVASGTRWVTVLDIRPFDDIGARLMIDDPLPGGFEIDNPNLLNSASIKALDWIKPANPQNVEFRADRFLAAVDHSGSDAFQLAYVVRAVSPGEYHHPAAMVSDMYRPEYRANTATGRLTVTP
ncbi:alpha-2-macroglobulin family protein [Sulfitobacter sp. F26169L]|uniref:alpha-2-macroglobulin family protein n=1 Tax=Sulfitobacter sp. F26169L TaxID=2996015 RepID=UPI002260F119|nr:alpha-2-macroglobulin family protein [Sulfitobacter sp. F26169L]MCX7565738.1 alpha-2-macroglobulin family protein [Sulfitobacter sp. F26169L]